MWLKCQKQARLDMISMNDCAVSVDYISQGTSQGTPLQEETNRPIKPLQSCLYPSNPPSVMFLGTYPITFYILYPASAAITFTGRPFCALTTPWVEHPCINVVLTFLFFTLKSKVMTRPWFYLSILQKKNFWNYLSTPFIILNISIKFPHDFLSHVLRPVSLSHSS